MYWFVERMKPPSSCMERATRRLTSRSRCISGRPLSRKRPDARSLAIEASFASRMEATGRAAASRVVSFTASPSRPAARTSSWPAASSARA